MRKKVYIMVAVAILLLISTSMCGASQYGDEAKKLSTIGVFKGTGQGFELDRRPSRLEGAVMFVRLLGGENEALSQNYAHPFTDVPGWGSPYVGYLWHHRLTRGMSETQFGSNFDMQAASYLTFVLRALGYDDTAGDFTWSGAVDKGREIGLLDAALHRELLDSLFLRDHVAVISLRALGQRQNNSDQSLAARLVNAGAISEEKAVQMGLLTANSMIYATSPFGMHPANIRDRADIVGSFAEAVDIGVRWHRPSMYMFWSEVQKDLDQQVYDFSLYDVYYGSVPVGMNILGNISPNPKRVTDYSLPGSYLPIDENKYIPFVKEAVERYDGDGLNDMPDLKNPITHWQVGNEPNNKGIADFAALQKITYEAIKEACPDCTVVIGGVAQPMKPTSGFITDKEEYFSEFRLSYEPYLRELRGRYFDVFDFHWYGRADGDYRELEPVYRELEALLKTYGYGDVPVWITEMGSYSGTPVETFASYQTEKEQAGDYLKRFVFSLSLGIEKVFPAFGLREGFTRVDGYFDHTGFIYDGRGSNDLGFNVRKLSYYTYKKMTEILEGSDWDKIETVKNDDSVYVFQFDKNGEPLWVAWNDNQTTEQITISGITSSHVRITVAVPDYGSGKMIVDYSTAFETEIRTVAGGQVTVPLGDSPVFIETIDHIKKTDAVSPTFIAVHFEAGRGQTTILTEGGGDLSQDMISRPRKQVLPEGEIIWLRHAALPDIYEDWFEFLQSQGQPVQTVRQILST